MISKREQMDSDLRFSHLHKLASLGELLSAMCHELNSPLTVVLAYSEILARNAELSKDALRQVSAIHTASLRMMKIVGNTLKLSKCQTPTYNLIDLNQVIASTIPLFDYQRTEQKIDIVINLTTESVYVMGDFYQLQQVIFNLIMNAMQAMQPHSENGKISISTVRLGRDVKIIVEDNGCGIKEENIKRIFNSFFTTKTQGLGLGLSIVKDIIESHGGNIDVDSNEGSGTTFFITLPVQI